ncbi:DUF4345 domain-containing protein [Pseudomonas sp. PB3P13]
MNTALKKYFLIIAFLAVGSIALVYGVSPTWFALTFFGMDTLDINIAHILRAVMCLYLALGIFWLVCAFRPTSHHVAILTVLIFCGGLFVGRLISFMIDGLPSMLLQLYAGIELAVIPVACWLLRLHDSEDTHAQRKFNV